MLFDNILTKKHKIIISMIFGMLWIYERSFDCYDLLPRKNIFASIIVAIWIYLNYKEPLFLPIGLLLLYFFCINMKRN